MNIYKEYLTESEREMEAFNQECELGFAKIDMMLEMVDMELELAFKNSELVAVRESASYDDLQAMYEEAVENAEEKKEGIWASFKKFLSEIWKKFTGLFKKKVDDAVNEDPDSTVEIDKTDEENLSKVQTALNDVKNIPTNFKAGKWGDALKTITGVLGTISGIAVAATITTKVVLKRKELGERLKSCNSLFDSVRTSFDVLFGKNSDNKESNDKEKEDKGGFMSKVKELFNKVKNFLQGLGDKITGKIEEIKDNAEQRKRDAQEDRDWKPVTDEEKELDRKIKEQRKKLANAKDDKEKANIQKGLDHYINQKHTLIRNRQAAGKQQKIVERGAKGKVSAKEAEQKKSDIKEKGTTKQATIKIQPWKPMKTNITIDGKSQKVEVRKTLGGKIQFKDPADKSGNTWKNFDKNVNGSEPTGFKKDKEVEVRAYKNEERGTIRITDPMVGGTIPLPSDVNVDDAKFESVMMYVDDAIELFGESFTEFISTDEYDYLNESLIDSDELYAGYAEVDENVLNECVLIISEL